MKKSIEKISVEEVRSLAALAHIPIPETELASFAASMEPIIAHMEEIRGLFLDHIPETERATEEVNAWREDAVAPSLSQAEALRNGTSFEGYFETEAMFES